MQNPTDLFIFSSGLNPCSWKDRGGCSHLCLPTGVINFRCSCPSLGGLVIKNKTCVGAFCSLSYYIGQLCNRNSPTYSIIQKSAYIITFSSQLEVGEISDLLMKMTFSINVLTNASDRNFATVAAPTYIGLKCFSFYIISNNKTHCFSPQHLLKYSCMRKLALVKCLS